MQTFLQKPFPIEALLRVVERAPVEVGHMNRWFVLPYDESLVADLALRRVDRLAQIASVPDGGIVLAVCGADPAALGPVIGRARALVSPDVRLEGRLIAASDPGGSLIGIVADRPNAALTAPLGVVSETPWYVAAVQSVLTCRTCPVFAFYMDGEMVKEAREVTNAGFHLARLLGGVIRGSSRLRLGR